MIGICVVYLAKYSDSYELLDFSVAQIKRLTDGPFRIYGCCPDNDAETLRRMTRNGVNIQTKYERNSNVSYDHAISLNGLVDQAVAEGCQHVATFDMDSWPILQGWDLRYEVELTEETPVASIVRTELQDNFPFAAFTIMRSGFWRCGRSSFSVVQRSNFSDEGAALPSRPGETGSGILAQLYDDGLCFLRLERSNAWNVHAVMAAVYDNTIFHLGAGSRASRFRTDGEIYRLNRSPIRRRFADEMNAAIQAFSLSEILSQHDEFVAELAGANARPLMPIVTNPKGLPKTMSLTHVDDRKIWLDRYL